MKKETKKEILEYVISSATLLGFSLIFSLLSMTFILVNLPKVAQFLLSFIFIAPIFFVAYVQGKNRGEKLFKAKAKTTLDDIHGEKAVKIPYYKCVYHVLGFVVPLVILFILAVILQNKILRLIPMLFEFPAALMFTAVNVLNMEVVSPITLAVFLPYTLIEAGIFILAYILKIKQLRRQHADIESEIRSFDN